MEPLKRIWTVFWKSGLFLVLWGVLLAPLIVPFSAKLNTPADDYAVAATLYFELVGMLTILAAAWFMMRFIDRRPFLTLGWRTTHLLRDGLRGMAIGCFWLALSLAMLWLSGWAKPQTPENFAWSPLATAAVAMMLNTVTQEVLARGYIFQTIASKTGPRWAIFFSAVLFVLYHAGGLKGAPLAALNVFGAGVLFGVAFHLSGNLWLPISIHFAWNFLLGPVLGLSISGHAWTNGWRLFTLQGPSLLTGGAFGLEGSLVVTLTTVLSTALIVLWYGKRVAGKETSECAEPQAKQRLQIM